MKFSRDAALSRIPAPHLLKQEQLQLAGASFRDIELLRSACKNIWEIEAAVFLTEGTHLSRWIDMNDFQLYLPEWACTK